MLLSACAASSPRASAISHKKPQWDFALHRKCMRRRRLRRPLPTCSEQVTFFHPRDRLNNASRTSPYQITARLTAVGGEFQCLIRATHETHYPAASERELRAI